MDLFPVHGAQVRHSLGTLLSSLKSSSLILRPLPCSLSRTATRTSIDGFNPAAPAAAAAGPSVAEDWADLDWLESSALMDVPADVGAELGAGLNLSFGAADSPAADSPQPDPLLLEAAAPAESSVAAAPAKAAGGRRAARAAAAASGPAAAAAPAANGGTARPEVCRKGGSRTISDHDQPDIGLNFSHLSILQGMVTIDTSGPATASGHRWYFSKVRQIVYKKSSNIAWLFASKHFCLPALRICGRYLQRLTKCSRYSCASTK